MAKVFISYARSDAAVAERIARALEGAGHSVWWDQAIHAGSRFSAEIEEALDGAQVVVVLWSAASVKSAWVHDEASVGRDDGKLVPVLIENIKPPLGFRQYQAVKLHGRLRGGDAALQLLVDAVAGKVGAAPSTGPIAGRRSTSPKLGWKIPTVLVALVLLLGVGWLAFFRTGQGGAHSVVVVAAEGGDPARSAEMARTIAADLGRYRAGPLGGLTILRESGKAAGKAEYRIEVGISGNGNTLRADVSLVAPKQSQVLWTTSVEGPASRLVDLRQQATAKLGDVLTCAVEAAPYGETISQEALGLYFNGCSRVSDVILDASDQTALSIFRQVTSKAPDFAPGWAHLAWIEGNSFPGTPESDHPALVKSVKQHLEIARRLDPALPEVVAADAIFYPNDGTKPGRALAILDRGLARQPDSALLHRLRSEYLMYFGRVNEAVSEAASAFNLKPLSPAYVEAHISSLAYAGRIGPAYEELKKAEAIWPQSTVLSGVRYRLELRYGDPKEALRLLQKRGAGDLRPVPMDTAWKAFIEARMDPTPARISTALEAFRQRHRRDPGDIPGFIQALGTFGRVDEAFAAVAPAGSLDSMMPNGDILFRPHMHRIRSDPRFIGLAFRLGMLTYWRKSGVWPDFCREARLPYNCQTEAAKYPLEFPPYTPMH